MVLNLTDKLSNERPAIELCGKTFDVNNTKDAVLKLSEMQNDSLITAIPEAIRLLLGEEAAAEIDAMHLSWANYETVFFAAVAQAMEEDFDEVKSRFQHGKSVK